MSLPPLDSSALVDAGNLKGLQQAAAAHDPQALRAAAQQFESLFTSMMLKSMRQANFSDPLFGSDQGDMYQDMYDDQIASEISKGRGLGLADMLVQQLRRSGLAGTSQGTTTGSTGAATGATSSTAAAATAPSSTLSGSSSPSAAGNGAAGSSTAGSGGTGSAAASSTATTIDASSAATTASSDAASCPATTQQLQFAQSLWPQAQQAARQLGVSPVSLLAQAALETDWGRSMPRSADGSSSNNLFGIKAGGTWSGSSVANETQEYDSGAATTVKAQFRAYATPGQCFTDYVSMLQSNPRYAAALGTGSNTQAFAAALQRGGYATDPAYATKIGAVANTLTRALTQARQVVFRGVSPGAGALKSADSLPTTSGSNTL